MTHLLLHAMLLLPCFSQSRVWATAAWRPSLPLLVIGPRALGPLLQAHANAGMAAAAAAGGGGGGSSSEASGSGQKDWLFVSCATPVTLVTEEQQ